MGREGHGWDKGLAAHGRYDMTEPSAPVGRPEWATELTDRQWMFVEEYLIDLNGTQAAIRAGYAESGAAVEASRLLRNAKIASAVDSALAERPGVTRARIVEELASIAFANMQDYMQSNDQGDPYLDFSDLTREQAAALAEVTVEDFTDGRGEDARNVRRVKFKLSDKQGALEKLGKALSMFKDRVDVNHGMTNDLAAFMERIATNGRRVHDPG